jgi:hypothetical protein
MLVVLSDADGVSVSDVGKVLALPTVSVTALSAPRQQLTVRPQIRHA